MGCSTPGLPVHHQLLEFTQTHVYWVGDAIQPSHPLSSPSPPAFPSFRVFSNESTLGIRWPKYWSFSFSISPSNEHSGLISTSDHKMRTFSPHWEIKIVGGPSGPELLPVSSPLQLLVGKGSPRGNRMALPPVRTSLLLSAGMSHFSHSFYTLLMVAQPWARRTLTPY